MATKKPEATDGLHASKAPEVALTTGAGQGIGRAIASRLAKDEGGAVKPCQIPTTENYHAIPVSNF